MLKQEDFLRNIPRFVSSHLIAKAVNIFLIITIIFGVIAIISSYLEINLLTRIEESAYYSEDEIQFNDYREAIIGLFQIIIIFITGILFIIWFYRSHCNLKALGNRYLKYGSGWAIGGFFVPILNLFRPYQVMKEIWMKSNPNVNFDVLPGSKWKESNSSTLVGWWWFLFILGNILGYLPISYWAQEESINMFITGDWLSISVEIVDIVAAIITIRLINEIVRWQERKHEKMMGYERESLYKDLKQFSEDMRRR